MKFILFDVQDVDKTFVLKTELDDKHYINEIIFSKGLLKLMDNQPKHMVAKIKHKLYDKKIEKLILKALDNYDKKWYYLLSKNMTCKSPYLTNKLEQLLGYKLTNTNEMDSNIFKYVTEYLNENKQLKQHEIKVLIVVTNQKNLNVNLISNLIKEYKCVNIYLKEHNLEYLSKRIKQINKTEGTTIEILKKERKSFAEYNVVYFIDDCRENYPRFRLNKNAKVIDLQDVKQDKYNSNIVYMNDFLNKQGTNKLIIQELKAKYAYLELAQAVRKITNVLDKS